MSMPADEPADAPGGSPGLYRLLAWLSPGFPIGAFSYSHGLEAAVGGGAVHDRASLERWVTAIVAHGSGRIDADILRDAYRAAAAGDLAALDAANRRGVAFRATAELALESAQQGAGLSRHLPRGLARAVRRSVGGPLTPTLSPQAGRGR